MADQFDSDLGDDILDAAPSSVFESPVITLANILVPSTYVAYLDTLLRKSVYPISNFFGLKIVKNI